MYVYSLLRGTAGTASAERAVRPSRSRAVAAPLAGTAVSASTHRTAGDNTYMSDPGAYIRTEENWPVKVESNHAI